MQYYYHWSLHILASGLGITQQSSTMVCIPLAPLINQTAMFDRKVLSLSPQALRPYDILELQSLVWYVIFDLPIVVFELCTNI